jgi:hypothetical protein
MIKTAVMKLLTVKAAAVVALSAAGGVAVAASTGTLPTTRTGSERHATGLSVATSHGAGKPSARPSADDGRRNHRGGDTGGAGNEGSGDDNGGDNGGQDGTGPDGAKGSPSPSLVGLCHAFGAGNKDQHGKALDTPAFAALISAAGGQDKVSLFCATLLASAAPKEQPSQAGEGRGNSGEHGNGSPADHPTGKPSTVAHP